ncbi:general secretion pathway protein N [Sphingorhabdus rigui]|uniref:Type II secretion system protein N n=1 Tax=Sphingorhabdus rigui TaxID=1282858 RepID=A0A840B366_9SPHN|nr:type II secretion system protein N [Sphingorhabdus rigui]MBB3943712.1 general secretion pathway protein N [Sphingorhabdus rigui]
MSRRLVVMWAVLLMLSVILFMPLRAIVSGEGVSARTVGGIIWDGSIRDLRLGKLPIGDVNARLLVGPLFLGRADILLSRGNAPYRPGFTGTVSRGFGSMSVNNLNATLPIAALFAPFPAENIQFEGFSAKFAAGRCMQAGGQVRLIMSDSLPGLNLQNGMLGQPRCDGAGILLPLVSQSAMERADIRLSADGIYTVTVTLDAEAVEQGTMLTLAGFRPVAGGYRLVQKGRF